MVLPGPPSADSAHLECLNLSLGHFPQHGCTRARSVVCSRHSGDMMDGMSVVCVLGCSIEISRDIYIYSVCRGPKCVGGITWAKHVHAQIQFGVVKTDLRHP